MSKQKPLTALQQKLLGDLKAGAICHYMPYPSAYYFCTNGIYRCTAQVKALLARGLVEEFDHSWRGAKVRIKPSELHQPKEFA